MSSFLNSAIPGIRCQNPGCQAAASAGNPITVEKLLYTGWTCNVCGDVYTGALIEETHFVEAEVTLKEAMSLDDMDREGLVAELERWTLRLEDVPVSGKMVSNEDIRKYLVSSVATNAQPQTKEG